MPASPPPPIELLQGTFIDITAQKKAQARLRDVESKKFAARAAEREDPEVTELSERLAALLGNVSRALQPHNLTRLDRTEMQGSLLALEEMKMLMSRLEILRLLEK